MEWFQSNLDIVFFIYGLAFAIMGIIILIQPKKDSGFKPANILWLLGVFGVSHGVNEFLDMWAIIKGRAHGLDITRWLMLIASYFFLFEFGRQLIRITPARGIRSVIARYLGWWCSPIIGIFIIIAGLSSADIWQAGTIWARYLLGFPGGLLIAHGFLFYYKSQSEILNYLGVKKYFQLLGIAFFAYGILGGLIVPKAGFFPADCLNVEWFQATVKIPVQVFRAVCAVISMYAVNGLVAVFNWERKKEVYNLLATREKITEGITEGILLVDRNYKVIWANKKIRDAHGEVIGDTCHHATHHQDFVCQPPDDVCPITEVMKTGRPITVLHTHYGKDKRQIYTEVSAYPVRDERGEITEFVHLSRDVTEILNLNKLIRNINTSVLVVSPEGRIAVANPQAGGLTGYAESELLAMKLDDIVHPDFRGLVKERLCAPDKDTRTLPRYEFKIVKKTGQERWVESSASLIDYEGKPCQIITITDISERKAAESQKVETEELLRQSQKMEAVGQLTGGVAHEFNNILAVIMGNVHLLQSESPDSRLKGFIESIAVSADKGAHITQGLLTFSRKQITHLKPVDLNEVVRSSEKLISRLVPANIRLKTALAEAKLAVQADFIQIEQVLINLVANARDAMLARTSGPNGGDITVSTELVELDDNFIKAHGYEKPGLYALLAVTDAGIGMDESVKARIFEPFFTTKELGKGTGLGLPIVYGIVTKHNGYIDIHTQPGKGTIVQIYLPLVEAEAKRITTKSISVSRSGTETILLAEDNDDLRVLTADVLRRFGYKVIEARDGAEAVTLFRANQDKIKLLLFDVLMPRKSGKEAYDIIRVINPDIR